MKRHLALPGLLMGMIMPALCYADNRGLEGLIYLYYLMGIAVFTVVINVVSGIAGLVRRSRFAKYSAWLSLILNTGWLIYSVLIVVHNWTQDYYQRIGSSPGHHQRVITGVLPMFLIVCGCIVKDVLILQKNRAGNSYP